MVLQNIYRRFRSIDYIGLMRTIRNKRKKKKEEQSMLLLIIGTAIKTKDVPKID